MEGMEKQKGKQKRREEKGEQCASDGGGDDDDGDGEGANGASPTSNTDTTILHVSLVFMAWSTTTMISGDGRHCQQGTPRSCTSCWVHDKDPSGSHGGFGR